MNTKLYLAGIDAGTTGTTVMIADTTGRVIGSAYREYPCVYPRPGWVEQDMELMWQKICEASQEVIVQTEVDPKTIAGLGFSSQRGSFVCVDAQGKPVHYAIVWNDGRANKQAQEVAARLGEARYRQITGMPISALWSFAKIRWFIEHYPHLWDKTAKIVNGQEFFLQKLGAETFASDPASLTLNGMLDIEKLDWSREICDIIEVPLEKLPSMMTPASQVGTISKQAAAQTGFAEGMPICRGGGDQQCAAIGAGVIREGLAEITIGTAAMMVAHIDSRRADPKGQVYIGGHAIPHKWDMEGGAFASGACLRWWRDVYGQVEQDTARRLGLDAYDLITAQAALAPPGSQGLLFFPFFTGQVTPFYNSNARGGSLGLSLSHNRSTVARAVLEGSAYELRMVVSALEEVLGRPFDTLRLTGGGAKSSLWTQIQADIYGRPVETLQVSECTTLGAALLGGVGIGVFSSIEEAVEAMVHPDRSIEPDQRNQQLYNELYELFVLTYKTLANNSIYEKLVAIQDRFYAS